VRAWLLAYARAAGEPADVIARAGRLMTRPEDVGGHDDHLHVRVRCAPGDVARGRCRDAPASAALRPGRVVLCPDQIARR
jgi:penicillin-insensitive murein endopeptidase